MVIAKKQNNFNQSLVVFFAAFSVVGCLLAVFYFITLRFDIVGIKYWLLLNAILSAAAVGLRSVFGLDDSEVRKLTLHSAKTAHLCTLNAVVHIIRNLLVTIKRVRLDATNLEPWQIIHILSFAEKDAEEHIATLSNIENPEDSVSYYEVKL